MRTGAGTIRAAVRFAAAAVLVAAGTAACGIKAPPRPPMEVPRASADPGRAELVPASAAPTAAPPDRPTAREGNRQ